MTNQAIGGLHHVTAICGDPQRNHGFYTGILGLRLVKKTVNFDDPTTYHLYYADGSGTPGSVMTFFPWKDSPRGRDGIGQVSATAFAVAEAALPLWVNRLKKHGVEVRGPSERFGEACIAFEDPDGLPLEIVVADQSRGFQPWAQSPVPADMQLRGFHSVTLSEGTCEMTESLLTRHMGWAVLKKSEGRRRYQAPGAGPASIVDVVVRPGTRPALPGSGTVHHVAFRVDDDDSQRAWRETLVARGHHVSPVMDRSYFHSIYYREPGGVLIEIATNPPGFATDEPIETLGSALMLPPQYEALRGEIERALPPLSS
jgi:glyoxalase family protein